MYVTVPIYKLEIEKIQISVQGFSVHVYAFWLQDLNMMLFS